MKIIEHPATDAADPCRAGQGPPSPTLVVCATCRSGEGSAFGRVLDTALTMHACRGRIEIESIPCLFACRRSCTAYLRDAHRMGYVLGGFAASGADAAALLDFVEQYLATADGLVPYARWPDAVKGHFLVRVPPAGFANESCGMPP